MFMLSLEMSASLNFAQKVSFMVFREFREIKRKND
jgi:hypothetical protein